MLKILADILFILMILGIIFAFAVLALMIWVMMDDNS